MKLRKSLQREKKDRKRKTGMRISGKSVFTIQRIQVERAEKIKKDKK